tara:strand:+ start:2341 stop:2631 length:291 start_codon:yes stop_codon:yes gene_type:complete
MNALGLNPHSCGQAIRTHFVIIECVDTRLNPHSCGQAIRTDLLQYPDFSGRKQPVSKKGGKFPFGPGVFAPGLGAISVKSIIMAGACKFSTGELCF